LHEALKQIGIEPTKQPWTVKLTGGPDGDVAGNMLKIMARDYGEHVKVVGLADGSGCAEDPDGLPMGELLRMFDAALPLAEMNTGLLGPRGKVTLANTPEGIAARNTLHNRITADAFVPGGGRPSTMNASNWSDFLLPDGSPSCKVIVEGANLFLTPEARLSLFEATGLPVVKDSSANKCGVICSSMEIVASMVCSDDEFVAMKAEYVEQVVEKLRELARMEAARLFAEAARDRTIPLPALSERISFAIIRVNDALDAHLDTLAEAERAAFEPLVSAQLPAAFTSAGFAPRIPEKLPWEYRKSAITAGLASRLVYREGLAFVEGMPDARLPAYSHAYLEQEQRVTALAHAVAVSGHAFGAEVSKLLLKGGVRVAAERAAPN